MEKDEYKRIDMWFRKLSGPYIQNLSRDGAHNVEHYLNVAEIEMAFESFVLSAIEEQLNLPPDAKTELLAIGLALGMPEESVFKADFWQFAYPYLSNFKK